MRRQDLATLRPWVARPSQTGRDSAWEVAAPARYPPNREALVACMLSEADARLIAAAPRLLAELKELVGAVAFEKLEMRGVIGCDDAREAIAMAEGEDFDPAAEDEQQLSRT